MENSVIVNPRFHTGFSNNDFLKVISSRQQRTKFGFFFVFIVDIKRRLNIMFIHTVVHHKIYFELRLVLLTVRTDGGNLNDAHVNRIAASKKFVVNDILHYMSFFLLTEIQPGVTKSHIRTIKFRRIRKIFFTLDVKSFCLVKQERLFEVVQIRGNRLRIYVDISDRFNVFAILSELVNEPMEEHKSSVKTSITSGIAIL